MLRTSSCNFLKAEYLCFTTKCSVETVTSMTNAWVHTGVDISNQLKKVDKPATSGKGSG